MAFAARASMLGGGLLLGACSPSPFEAVSSDWRCDARELGADEVRARRIPCGDELVAGGDARRSDWLLENNRVRIAFRDEGAALTRFDIAGGTIVDMAPVGANDVLEEVVPSVDGQWFTELEIRAEEAEGSAALVLEGLLADGSSAEVRYILHADDGTLEVEGIDQLTLVPGQGSVLVGDSVELSGDLLWTTDGALSDRGGWLDAEAPTRVFTGTRDEVARWSWPDGDLLSGETRLADGELLDGEHPLIDASAASDIVWVTALDASGESIGRWPSEEGSFSAWLSPEAHSLRLDAPGFASDELVLAELSDETTPVLTAGEHGFLRVEIEGDDGLGVPARVVWGDRSWAVPSGGLLLATGPGTESLMVSAGPAYERVEADSFDVSEVTELAVVLPRTPAPRILADIGVESWPDEQVRMHAADVARQAMADGARFVVLVADDEVAYADELSRDDPWLEVRGGSRASSPEHGSPLAWPWSRNDNKGGQGAAPWTELDALDLLAVMDDGGRRRTVVDADWVASAGDPTHWAPKPLALRLGGLDDLPVAIDLLDAFQPVLLLGDRTWVEGLDDEQVWSHRDVEAMLLAGRGVASNGPYVALEVDDVSTGGAGSPHELAHEVRVRATAPTWMDLDTVEIVGPGGEVLATFEASATEGWRVRGAALLPADLDWVLAVARGDEAAEGLDAAPWAISNPVWLSRP